MTEMMKSATEANTTDATGDCVVANSIMKDGLVIVAHSLSDWNDYLHVGDVKKRKFMAFRMLIGSSGRHCTTNVMSCHTMRLTGSC